MNHLESQVTLFRDVTETQTPHFVPLSKALERIKSGRNKQLIDQIREYARKDNKEAANKNKAKLPCVLFSGKFDTEIEIVNRESGEVTYSKRTDDSLTEHSGVVILDYDNIEPHQLKPKLSQDPYILACWTSPSGNGVKALVKIQNGDKHRDHYRSILAHFSKYGELDTSNINPSRVCYESFDPALYINEQSWVWSGLLEEKKPKNNLGSLTIGVYDYDYSKIQPIIKYIRNAMEGERHTKLNKSAYTLGGYIATGYLPKDLSRHILLEEYKRINPEEPFKEAERAVDSGIQAGLLQPIWEFENHEKEFLQEVGESQMDFVFDYEAVTHELMRVYSGETEETFTTGYENLDPYFIWKRSQFIVNLGNSNVGKTWTAFWMAMCTVVIHGWKWIIFSAENKPKHQIRDLMQMVAQKKLHEMNSHEVRFYNEFVREHFEFVKNDKIYSYQEILDYNDSILSRKHYDYCLIDPYNSLSRKGLNRVGSSHDYDNEAAASMLSWANNRDTGLWLNIHTYTHARRQKDANGYAKKPFKDDSEGGGKWDSKSDIFTITHRIVNHQSTEERFITDFSVEKIRDKDSGGDIHPYTDPFRMKMQNGVKFIDYNGGQLPFHPPKPNIQEF